MISAEQKKELEQLEYYAVFSDRGSTNPAENTYSVKYPNKRPDAVFNWYSHATFQTSDLAWAEAQRDFEAGHHLIDHGFRPAEDFVLEDAPLHQPGRPKASGRSFKP